MSPISPLTLAKSLSSNYYRSSDLHEEAEPVALILVVSEIFNSGNYTMENSILSLTRILEVIFPLLCPRKR